MFRTALTLTTTALVGLTAGSAAEAQSRCGEAYRIQSGDTLYQVSQACRVPLSRIMELNPGIEPRDLSVGEVLTLTASGSVGGSVDTGGNTDSARHTYRVEQGDTAFSIAQALGVSVVELLNENPELDPLAMAVGEALDLPNADEPSAGIRVRPLAGPPGSEVQVTARNLRPDDYVTIGLGRTASEWRAIDQARVGADGELATEVALPDWTEVGDDLIFVVDTDRGVTLKSRPYDVVSREDTDGSGEQIALEGRIRSGIECATLTTPDGDLWTLTGEMQFTPGAYAEVQGKRAEMSFCQQGIGTVSVDSYEEVRAPGNLPGDTTDLSREDVVGPWARKGGNCARPDFDVTGRDGRLTVETALDGAPRTGRVRINDDGASMVFDQPYRAFDLENRGEGQMAVIAGGGATLGGADISDDGAVFVRCGL